MTHLFRRFWAWLVALFSTPRLPELPEEDPLAWTVTFWTEEDEERGVPGFGIGPTRESEESVWLRIGRALVREPNRWKNATIIISGPGFPVRALNREEKRRARAFARRVA